MKIIILFALLFTGWYKYATSGSTSFLAFVLLLIGSVILIIVIVRAAKKILAAQNVVAAAATFNALSEEQKTRVHDHAILLVSKGWRGLGDPSFGDDAEKFGWYAPAMHELGITPICLIEKWNYVRNPFSAVFVEDSCVATCVRTAQRQGYDVKLQRRASSFSVKATR